MLSMRNKIDEKYPNCLSYGCSSHYLNIVEKEVTPKSVLKHIVEIQKFFKHHHRPSGYLKEKGGKSPQLPNDTRWNSQLACLETYIFNYQKYREIMKEHEEDCPMSIQNKLEDMNIYKNALDLKEQLNIVGSALDKVSQNKKQIIFF